MRYLNAVGGGRIVRIEGNIAVVDDDGFETPVLLRECVAVSTDQNTRMGAAIETPQPSNKLSRHRLKQRTQRSPQFRQKRL